MARFSRHSKAHKSADRFSTRIQQEARTDAAVACNSARETWSRPNVLWSGIRVELKLGAVDGIEDTRPGCRIICIEQLQI